MILENLLYNVSVSDVMETTQFAAIMASDDTLLVGKFKHNNKKGIFYMEYGFIFTIDEEGISFEPQRNVGTFIDDVYEPIFKGKILEPNEFLTFMLILDAYKNLCGLFSCPVGLN